MSDESAPQTVPTSDPTLASLVTPGEGKVEHVYHAAVDDKDFEIRCHLPIVPKGQPLTTEWFAAMKALVDECSPSIWDAVKPLPCCACGKAGIRLIHHPMLYDTRDPPRVEDLPQPVCGKANCTAKAEQEFRTMMSVMSPTTTEGKSCGHCCRAGESLLRCSRCKASYYCDAACQKAHWPSHKVICKPN